jgi:Tfp pilus assembly protein PilX
MGIRPHFNTLKNNRSGMAVLVLVVIVLVALMILGMMIINTTTVESRIVGNERERSVLNYDHEAASNWINNVFETVMPDLGMKVKLNEIIDITSMVVSSTGITGITATISPVSIRRDSKSGLKTRTTGYKINLTNSEGTERIEMGNARTYPDFEDGE